MNATIGAAAAALVVFVCAACPAGQADEKQAKVERARQLLKLFLDGKYDAFVAAGDETMREKFSAEQAAQVGAQFNLLAGPYQSEISAEYTDAGGHDSVAFRLAGERATLHVQIVLDESGRLAGFWSRGAESNQPYEPPAYVDRDAFREEKVSVVTGAFELPGTLSLPKTRVLHPAVVLVHGSGPHDQDETVLVNKPFRDLAWGLASRGVAVLRYEKRTHKYGAQMKPAEITLDDETIDDALAAAALLRQRSDLDAQRIFVLGHSLGGMAAPLIAQRDPKLAGIIIMAGNARSILDLIEEQIEYIARTDGKIDETESANLDTIRDAIARIRAGKTDDPAQTLLGPPLVYWERLHRLDQVTAAERLTCPILIIQGGRDYQVGMKCFALWQKRLADHENVTFKLYEKLNHLMIAGVGPSTPAEYSKPGHVDEQLVRDVAEWVHARGVPK